MPLFFWKWPGIILLTNMKFTIGNNRAFYTQTLLWLGSLVGGIMYFVTDGSLVTLTEIVFMWFAILIRSVVISAKYATLSHARVSYYRKEVLPDEMFLFDMMFADWIDQTPKVLFLEQYRAMRRHEFENTIYKFDFLVDPLPLTKDAINSTDICFYLEWSANQPISESVAQVDGNTYNGFHIFGYLIGCFQKANPPIQVQKHSFIIGFILSISPVFIRIPYFLEERPGAMDSFRFAVNIFTSLNAFFGAFIFLRIALYDFKRKFFLLDQCLYLLSAKQVEYSTSKKLLPTINFNNPMTLQAWSMLRSISFDYGQTYNLRTQGFYSLIFAGMVFFIVVSFAVIMNLIQLQFFELVLLSEMAIVITGFTLAYLYHGAAVNEYFDEFETILEDTKSIYQDISRLRSEYFENNIDPVNAVHKIFVNMLKGQVGKQVETVKEYIDNIVSEIDDNLRLINYDRRNNPFKLYGVTVTFNLLKSAGVGLSTVYSYAIQQRLMA